MPILSEEEELGFWENSFTEEERTSIAIALASYSPWSENSFEKPTKTNLISAKIKLKNFHLDRTGNRCCYCRRSLLDATIESDREHIVPKGKVKSLTFRLFNLSISCKRCNMSYKRQKTEHIVDYSSVEQDLRNTERYRIPHPNIESYEDHLIRYSIQMGDQELVTYKRLTEKGKYLFDFVNLRALCIAELDAAQGGEKLNEFFATLLDLPVEGA
jgi:hypothetical protein